MGRRALRQRLHRHASDLVTDEPDISGLPPLDADAGLISRAWNAGDHIDVEVMTAAEALDEQASIAERGFRA